MTPCAWLVHLADGDRVTTDRAEAVLMAANGAAVSPLLSAHEILSFVRQARAADDDDGRALDAVVVELLRAARVR